MPADPPAKWTARQITNLGEELPWTLLDDGSGVAKTVARQHPRSAGEKHDSAWTGLASLIQERAVAVAYLLPKTVDALDLWPGEPREQPIPAGFEQRDRNITHWS